MKTLALSVALFAASLPFLAVDAHACRCAIPTTPDLIAAADAIVAGTVVWNHQEGLNNYSAIRFDRVVRVSGRVSEWTRESLQASVVGGEVGFFRGRLSDGRTSCPGVDVSRPVGSRLVYVAQLDEHGGLSIDGERIGHCRSFSAYVPAGSARFDELKAILGDLSPLPPKSE